jgi:hypothetical protein
VRVHQENESGREKQRGKRKAFPPSLRASARRIATMAPWAAAHTSRPAHQVCLTDAAGGAGPAALAAAAAAGQRIVLHARRAGGVRGGGRRRPRCRRRCSTVLRAIAARDGAVRTWPGTKKGIQTTPRHHARRCEGGEQAAHAGHAGYTWSYLACRIGHLVPIWQPVWRSP